MFAYVNASQEIGVQTSRKLDRKKKMSNWITSSPKLIAHTNGRQRCPHGGLPFRKRCAPSCPKLTQNLPESLGGSQYEDKFRLTQLQTKKDETCPVLTQSHKILKKP